MLSTDSVQCCTDFRTASFSAGPHWKFHSSLLICDSQWLISLHAWRYLFLKEESDGSSSACGLGGGGAVRGAVKLGGMTSLVGLAYSAYDGFSIQSCY